MDLIKKFIPLIIAVITAALSLPFIACMTDVVVEPPKLTLEYDEIDRPGASPSDWGCDEPYVDWDIYKPNVTYNPPISPKDAIDVDINELRRRIRISEKALKELKEEGGSGGKPGFGTGCFAPETEILMADGNRKEIGDVVVGERIKGYDLLESAFIDATIIRKHRTQRDSFFLINGVKVTAEHPFYTDRIWSKAHAKYTNFYDDKWIEAKDLSEGSRLFGDVVVKRMEFIDQTGIFVNLTVDGANNFFVIDSNGDYYLVHNKKVKF